MKTMTALEAKNAFGKLLDAAQREPVMVTKNNNPVAAMFSLEDIKELACAYLPASETEALPETASELIEAIMRQARVDNRIQKSRQEIQDGKGIEMSGAYFDDLRSRVKDRTTTKR